MTDAEGLIERHAAKGVLIDANLLVLYLVGKTNKARIEQFKRTDAYTVQDFELLDRLAIHFSRMYTTPHVLTEVSNLGLLKGRELSEFRSCFKGVVKEMGEFYEESSGIMDHPSFSVLGLTDAAIASIARMGLLVLTVDLDLYNALAHQGIGVINFNHIRPWNWR